MKKLFAILFLFSLLCLAGCNSEGGLFAGGFASGAATMAELANQTQEKFIASVNELNEKTAEINAGVDGIDGSLLIKPGTMEAIEKLKGIDEKDPAVWIALASMLAGGFFGGQSYVNRKKKIEVP